MAILVLALWARSNRCELIPMESLLRWNIRDPRHSRLLQLCSCFPCADATTGLMVCNRPTLMVVQPKARAPTVRARTHAMPQLRREMRLN